MTTIRLYNSKTRRKEDFAPLDAANVRMYVCGPTVYDRAHLGNARPVVVFDVLNRLLRHVYGADHVTYVRNFTDVDDKINAEALRRQKAGAPGTLEDLIAERTEETIGWYHADMDALGALRPDHEPRATAYIGQMIAMIETLIKKGFAYTKPISFGHNSRAVYFKSEKAPEHSFFRVDQDHRYGELSGRSLEEMVSGAKSEIGEGKINPMDFVLWKPSSLNEPGWESPWGFGRPGWHIECSAMAKALLGSIFDIHGGGIDLQFPHHENEIAQSCCANGTSEMARFWMHNEMLMVEGKKMSKSLGNFFTVRDLLDQGVPGEVIRFVLLSTHYRSPMDWTQDKARQAELELAQWRRKTNDVTEGNPSKAMMDCLSDDLNTHAGLTELRALFRAGDYATLKASAKLIGLLEEGLGAWSDPVSYSEEIGSTLDRVVRKWGDARNERDYDLADRIKAKLSEAAVVIDQGRRQTDPTAFVRSLTNEELESLGVSRGDFLSAPKNYVGALNRVMAERAKRLEALK